MGNLAIKFGKRLQYARKRRGFQVEELARAVGVSIQTVTFWQSGKKFPRVDNLETLAEVLQFPVAWFFLDGEQDAAKKEEIFARLEAISQEATGLRRELRVISGIVEPSQD